MNLWSSTQKTRIMQIEGKTRQCDTETMILTAKMNQIRHESFVNIY
jgi:hypothetical protein